MNRRFLSLVGSLLLLSLALAIVFPYWQGRVIRPRNVSVPQEYYTVASILNSDKTDYRVLSLPFFSSITFVSYLWGYSGASGIMPYLVDHSFFSSALTIGSPSSEQLDALLREAVAKGDKETFYTLLYLYSMGKIVVNRDADPNRYKEEFPWSQIESLMDGNSITFINSYGGLDLYNNADYLPYVYATTDVDCIAKDANAKFVVPFSLLKTAGSSRALVDTCSTISSSFSTRVFVLAQAVAKDDRTVFNITVPISGTYELFSSLPISCLVGPGINCDENQWIKSVPGNQIKFYSPAVTLALNPGTYQFQSAIQANENQTSRQTDPKGALILRSIEGSHGTSAAPSLSYNKVNPTNYQVDVKDATSPFLLVLAESYNSGWKAFVDGKELTESSHLQANGYSNAWLLDRTGNYNVTLEFTPQKFVYIGLAISSFVVILSLSYLAYRLFKMFRNSGFFQRVKDNRNHPTTNSAYIYPNIKRVKLAGSRNK